MNTAVVETVAGEVELLAYLRKRWKWLALVSMLCAVLGAIYGLTATRMYRVEVVLAYAEDQQSVSSLAGIAGQTGGLASLAGINLGDPGSAKYEALGILQSRQLTAAFISNHGLLQRIYASRWDETSKAWRSRRFNERPPTISDAVKVFSRDIRRVNVDPKSGLVSLTITWSEPSEAAFWANALVAETNEWLRSRAIRESEGRIEYLQKEIADSNFVQVNDALHRLIENEIKSMSIARTREEFAFRVVDPAVAPEEHDFVSPRPVANVAMGFMLGLGLAVVYFVMQARRTGSRGGRSRDASRVAGS